MKISNKITLLISALLLALAANSFVGLYYLTEIGRKLDTVAQQDIELTEVATTITQKQLEKLVLLERVIRIAEELAYDEVRLSRRKHLLGNARWLKDGFNELTKDAALEILRGKDIVYQSLKTSSDPQHISLNKTLALIDSIERAHIDYDEALVQVVEAMSKSDFQLDFDDIEKIRRQERQLTKNLKEFLSTLQSFTRQAVNKAEHSKSQATYVLWITLVVSLLLSWVIAFFIIRSIVVPLSKLVQASKRIGAGDFNIALDGDKRDEISDLSRTFNKMAYQLDVAKKELEQKNQTLAENLEITNTQKKELEKINKELDNFVHTVSHDLRSPLMGISGYGSVLNSQYDELFDDRGKRCVSGILKGTTRMNQMINDLLELTRVSRIRNPYAQISIKDVFDEVLGRLEYRIDKDHVKVKIFDELPVMVCDRIKITEAVFNLVSNGIKFSIRPQADKKHQAIIEVRYQKIPQYHEFSIKDNGIGIAEEHHDEVFGIFKRLDTAEEYEGTGAGLSIVKSVIDDHGGSIRIVSAIGQGAEFIFRIPDNLEVS